MANLNSTVGVFLESKLNYNLKSLIIKLRSLKFYIY